MRTDQKPFDDVRVRQAFRLMRRPQGDARPRCSAVRGTLGNDVFSLLDKSYPLI